MPNYTLSVMPAVLFKVEFNGKIKQAKKELASFNDLTSSIEQSFPYLVGKTTLYDIQFKDQQNEQILISSDDDLALAMNTMAEMKLYKFYVVSNLSNASRIVEIPKKEEIPKQPIPIVQQEIKQEKPMDKIKWESFIRSIASAEIKSKLNQSMMLISQSIKVPESIENKEIPMKIDNAIVTTMPTQIVSLQPIIPINQTFTIAPQIPQTKEEESLRQWREILGKTSKYENGKKNKKMAEGEKRKIKMQIKASPGKITFANFTAYNRSGSQWPDVYMIAKKRGDANVEPNIYTLRLQASQSADFAFEFRAPKAEGRYTLKLAFYYYNGVGSFISFGRVISVILLVKNESMKNDMHLQNATILEKEKVGSLEECISALECTTSIDAARKLLLSLKGLLN